MNRNDLNNLDYSDVNDQALLCSYLCTIAYSDRETQEKWLGERFDMDYFDSSRVGTLQYFMIFDNTNRKAYFVIRGSDTKNLKREWRDWRTNLRFWPKKVRKSKAHNGYVRSGNHLLPIMQEQVSVANDRGFDVIFTGHSLGGVLAKYVASMLDYKCEVYTFGAPALAKSEFYDSIENVTVHKYRMDGDLIPMFPSLIYDDVYGSELLLKRGSVSPDTADKKGLIAPFIFLTKVKLFLTLFTAIKTHNITVYTLNLLRKHRSKNK